ncbi:VanZ family protein [Streptococcus alactolyticus]|uniref:VanZ family protein n=1 Tax=Streptococcus alactolyticus TaxID=29389 RepID=UPI003F955192
MEIIKNIIQSVLTAFYQPFWAALIVAFVFMYMYLFSFHAEEGNKGWLDSIKLWGNSFKRSPKFRAIFFLAFYVMLVLFKTILNRTTWIYPLTNVFGGWWIWEINSDGQKILSSACFENAMLLIPFSFIYLRAKLAEGNLEFLLVIKNSVIPSFLLSAVIETIQLVFRIGNFQLSDIFYNTLGGFIGGIIYWICYKVKHRGSSL